MGRKHNQSRGGGGPRKKKVDPNRVKQLFAGASQAVNAGAYDEAERLLKQAESAAPDNHSILFNLGFVNHQVGRFARAIGYYRRCLKQRPDLPDTWLNLATAARSSGDTRIAIDAYEHVLKFRPDSREILNDLAAQYAIQGLIPKAVSMFRKVLVLDTGFARARLNLAEVLITAGKVDEAEHEFTRVLQADADNLQAVRSLFSLLDGQNRVDEAESVLVDYLETHDGDADIFCLLGNVQLKQGKHGYAEQSYRKALEKDNNDTSVLNNLGLISSVQSQRENAEKFFRKALSLDPTFGEGWRNLAALKKFQHEDDEDIAAMRFVLDGEEIADTQLPHFHFALGKAMDDCNLYDQAFKQYGLANALRRQQVTFNLPELKSHVERIKEFFSRSFFQLRQSWGDPSLLPVFIIGLPRTGTTLLEQILGAHSGFFGGGELLMVNRLIRDLEHMDVESGTQAYPECVSTLNRESIDSLARDYLLELSKLPGGTQAVRLSDKMPYNFFHIGLVHLLFPRAKIIQCLRDPLDTCLSAYFNYFPQGLDYTWSLADLAGFMGIYNDLMDHWRNECGLQILSVEYESLVRQPESQLDKVFSFLELDREPGVLEFHRSSKPVRTISAWQVRQPIHTKSAERWRNYREFIQPLIHALDQNGVDVSRYSD